MKFVSLRVEKPLIAVVQEIAVEFSKRECRSNKILRRL
jgi:hypothetical protein